MHIAKHAQQLAIWLHIHAAVKIRHEEQHDAHAWILQSSFLQIFYAMYVRKPFVIIAVATTLCILYSQNS